jgi:ParB family chromosome partitioning protein
MSRRSAPVSATSLEAGKSKPSTVPARSTQPRPGAAPFDPSGFIQLPLSRLVPSPFNVRKTAADGLDELSASILSHGLLQNLNVTPETGPDGQATGNYQVIAGGRRLAALSKLAREKRLPPAFPVPCRVVPAGQAQESSLAENIIREAMHPADQFEAFRALADQGIGTEAIAARFGVTAVFVRQRLKLAHVSPRLFERFRADEIGLDQLMALAITDDHAAQERVWEAAPEWRRTPQALRAALTESKVDAEADPRVRLVGLDAYLAAGGGIERDLFQEDHAGYLTDSGLLDRLVAEKLEAIAAGVRAEGWGWVEVSLAYPPLHEYGRIHPARVPLSPEAAAELAALESERDGLDERYDGEAEYPEEAATRLEAIESRIDQIQEGAQAYRPEEQALAGAIVALSGGGSRRLSRLGA